MSGLPWRKSTYSGDASNCVETATTVTTIHVRDSKTPADPHLTFPPTAWADFVSYAAGWDNLG
ncbi:DUF397 domain-containing protein [Streptomyces sp. NPDC086766]|uniref:DUF397 domain-containing protein n=1 Tax=Streptomyces sp. NPDC086766 TaxID=3365754 RepID=UPI003804F44B